FGRGGVEKGGAGGPPFFFASGGRTGAGGKGRGGERRARSRHCDRVIRTTQSATGESSTRWEGAEVIARKPGDLSPASQHDPRGRGGSEMRIIGSIAAAASLVALAALGPAGASASTGAELRVVSSSGQLDDLTQYSDTTDMPSSTQADCFFGSTGSGRSVTVQGANALGIVVEAAKSRDDLNPLLLTDAFVEQGLGMGVCGIGGRGGRGNALLGAQGEHKALPVGG